MRRAILNEQWLNGYIINENAPIGSIQIFSGEHIPNGYLECNGQALPKTNYSRLYSVIGDTYGSTETTFNIPDLRDKFVQGENNNLGTVKEAGLPNIEGRFRHTTTGGAGSEVDGAFSNFTIGEVQGNVDGHYTGNGVKFDASKSNSIYGNSDTVQPPSICMFYIIKATDYTQATEDILDDSKVTTGNVLSAAKVVEMNSYSTKEIIIGKWIDGIHDVATKTYLANIGTIGNGWKDITSVLPEVNNDNMELVLDVFAKGIYNNTNIQQSRAFKYEFREDKKLYLQMVGGDVQNIDTIILTYVKK